MLSEKTLKYIFNRMNSPVIICDKQGNYLLSNDAAKNLIGIVDLNPIKDNWSNYFGIFKLNGNPYRTEETPLYKAITYGKTTVNETLLVKNFVHPEGLYLSVNSFPIMDNNEIIGGTSIFTDVTHTIKLQQLIDEITVKFKDVEEQLLKSLKSHTDTEEPNT